jgi:cytochrome c-type biogenesis protein CcmH/NrfG
MSLVGLAIHIGLLALAVAILCPAALTLIALLIYEVVRQPQQHTETHEDPTPGSFF